MEHLSKFKDSPSAFDEGFTHDFKEKYNPKFIGSGGNSFVYIVDRSARNESRENVSSVMKVDIQSVTRCLQWINEHPDSDISEYGHSVDQQKYAENIVLDRKEKNDFLRHYYDSSAVPVERVVFVRIPISQELFDTAMPDDFSDEINVDEVFAIVTIQTIQSNLDDPDKTLNCTSRGYLENKDISDTDYLRVTKDLIFSCGDRLTIDEIKEFFPGIEVIIQAISKKRNVHVVLKTFVEDTIKLTAETGLCLDIAGTNNVIIDQQEPGVRLVDVFAGNFLKVSDALVNLEQMSLKEINSQRGVDLLNVLNYVRYINLLARILQCEPGLVLPIPKDVDDDLLEAKLLRLREVTKRQADPMLNFLYNLLQSEDK